MKDEPIFDAEHITFSSFNPAYGIAYDKDGRTVAVYEQGKWSLSPKKPKKKLK